MAGAMADAWRIAITDTADPRDARELRERIAQFNRDTTGFRDDRSLSCFLRDDADRLVAGLDGFTWGGYARVEFLWVDAPLRRQGVGRRLLDAAEREAAGRGCRTIIVDTHTFQAPGFYTRLGYVHVGTTTDTPQGHRQLLFQKTLS